MVSGMQKLLDALSLMTSSLNQGQVITAQLVQSTAGLAKARADKQKMELEAINAVLQYVAGSGTFENLKQLIAAFPNSQFIKDHIANGSSKIKIPEDKPKIPGSSDDTKAAEYRSKQTLFANEADNGKTVLQNDLNDATNLVTKMTQAMEGLQQTQQNLRTFLSDLLAIIQAFLQVLFNK